MICFLPSGRSIFNPESVKLVKVLPNRTQDSVEYIVIIKLDDDSELMVDTFSSEQVAYSFADQCADAVNAAENGEDFTFELPQESDSSVTETDDWVDEETASTTVEDDCGDEDSGWGDEPEPSPSTVEDEWGDRSCGPKIRHDSGNPTRIL